MTMKAYLAPEPFPEKVKLVILDLDCFLYPCDKTYRNAVVRAWRTVEKEYGLPIFRRTKARRLIEEAKEEANKNPDNALCRHISELARRLESKGFPDGSVIGMLEAYFRSREAARLGEEDEDNQHDQGLDPPYKEMIAMAFNLRLLQDRKRKKAGLTREITGQILEGDEGITRLWHKHMGTGFLRRDAALVNKIRRVMDAGVEVAVLTHSCKEGEGEAMEKLEKLGLKKVIPAQNIFGLEEISPYQKGKDPQVFENALAAINSRRDPADPIKPCETIMAEDTIGNLRGAKKAGMQTVWVPRRRKHMPAHPSHTLEKKLASVDHVYATPLRFLDALDSAIRASKKSP